MDRKPVVVIGAGAAGIFAALRAAQLGARVVLLEKTPRIGTKILISGGGKCNVTHDGTVDQVLRAFRPNEARFLRRSMYRFTNQQVRKLFEDAGLELYVRPDGRLFPVDKTAKHVVALLWQWLEEAGVELHVNAPVSGISKGAVGLTVHSLAGDFEARSAIVAVGGSSYPNSGTTGDGWQWAKNFGHTIVPPKAALAPITLVSMGGLPKAGVSLRDVILKGRQSGKEFVRWSGDALFTHSGVSGPCALGISREVEEHLSTGSVTLELDLLPKWTFETLTEHFLSCAEVNPKAATGYCIPGELPRAVLDAILDPIGLYGGLPIAQLPKKTRNRLIEVLKGWAIGEVKDVPLEKGEVTAGGVDLNEVYPETMESRLCPGLFLCGEVLDIAGPVGGYNLQAAFSTGHIAGESAANP